MPQDNRYLIRQRQTWYAVVEVPPSLQDRLGNRKKRTLRTRDIDVARARRWRVVADLKDEIEAARKGRQGDPVEQEALAWRDVVAVADRGEDVAMIPDDEDPANFIRGVIGDRVDALKSRRATADHAATFAGIALGTATPLKLCLDQWLADVSLRGRPLKERTKDERRRAVEKLGEWLARVKVPVTVEAVTRKVAGRYVSEELAPSGRDPVTWGKTVRSLAGYWAWLSQRGHLPDEAHNPWQGQATKKAAKDSGSADRERPFNDDEVARLLANPPDQTMADFMRVAALSGIRREAIGQLTVADCRGGIFNVRKDKTDAGTRRVPIHSGLCELVERRTRGKAADAFLFDELHSKNAERTDPIGKAFTRYRRSLGIQEGTGRRSRVNLHSFRRWFTTSALNAGQPERVVALVIGHAEGRKGVMLTSYWGGVDDPVLRACVESVRLPTATPSVAAAEAA